MLELKKIAEEARRLYEEWKREHPGEDPVANQLPDALWNLERVAQRVESLMAQEKARP